MSQTRLPAAVRHFVEQQTTLPVADLTRVSRKERHSPHGSYWYRAIACMMLSGRVRPKITISGDPNMIDVNRIGKEANFNPYLFERVAKFLVAAKVIATTYDDLEGSYVEGPNIEAFWEHDAELLPAISRQAILNFVEEHAGYRPQRVTPVPKAHLIEFLTLFFACFRQRAIIESKVGDTLHGFSRLPKDELVGMATELGIKASVVDPDRWSDWVDLKGGKILIDALYQAEWAYYAEYEKTGWWLASPTGLGMLGLDPPPRAPELANTFKATNGLSVLAGAGLAREKLVPLFRHCVIKRIDEVFEFRLDRKRLALTPAGTSPGEELHKVLQELEPLPAPIASLFATRSKLGGKIRIRWCSALVHPEDAEVLAAIREHPSLKGYLEPGAPPGYLLIRLQSDPDNFVQRCLALGFKVER
jgi:hypothetical protein